MSTEDIRRIDKIVKLLEHAQSAESLGSLEEAAAFAAKAQAIMNEMKLSMSDIEYAKLTNDKSNPIEESPVQAGPQRRAWAERLARVIAQAHQCRILVSRGGWIWFVGRHADRELAQHIFLILYRTCLELSKKENRKARRKARLNGNVSVTRGFVPLFRRGFIDEITHRYQKERDAMYAGLSAEQRGVAVIRLTGTEIQRYVDEKYTKKGRDVTGRQTQFNSEGYTKGREAGSKVDIRARAVNSSNAHKALKEK